QMQRLKRSLSLRTLLRSKSVESLFPRPGGGGPGPGTPPSPPRPHGFQQYVFKKHCPCELCRQLIAGNSRQGLRCKACKAGVHLWCSEGISHQQCPGKTATSFRRNFSSPLLLPEQGGSAQGEPPPGEPPLPRLHPALGAPPPWGAGWAGGALTPPSSSPQTPARGWTRCTRRCGSAPPWHTALARRSCPPAPRYPQSWGGGTVGVRDPPEPSLCSRVRRRRPGRRAGMPQAARGARAAAGKVGDRLGFFPANFVQRVRPGESVWRSCRAVQGDKEQGRMSLRENQICVGVGRTQGLVRVTSGKKRGLVPAEALTEI
ncbi:STAC2 protein, partial [Mesembrinibis cayennensis]|nr:STAC2 protein [Mesembrinibis cayennensis]